MHFSNLNAFEATRYQRINQELAYNHILPRYQQFIEQTKILKENGEIICNTLHKENLIKLQQSYHDALDSWMNVQHIQFGPVDKKLRSHRIYFWPDKHNSGRKHLGRLLKSLDRSLIAQDRFNESSVALQGFPALEKLLFIETEKLFSNDTNAQYRCLLIQAITNNIYNIANSIFEEWMKPGDGFLNVISSSGHPFYSGEDQMFVLFYKSLLNNLRYIHDLKLGRPLGKGFDKSRPKKSESWRTQRSLRNIIINLEAAKSLYEGDDQFGIDDFLLTVERNPKNAKEFQKYISQTIAKAKSIKMPLSEAVTETLEYKKLQDLQKMVLILIEIVAKHFSKSLQIGPGFNALDGD